MKKLPAEFLGTFFFCLTALLAGSPLAAGAVLAGLMCAFGYLSGGHFNPAVSLAVWLRGRMDRGEMLRCWAAQSGGGISALLMALMVEGGPEASSFEMPVFGALVGETVFTCLVALVFLHVTTARQLAGNAFSGLAVGLVYFAGTAALGRSLHLGACHAVLGIGHAVAGWVPPWMILVHLAAALAGGALAALTCRIMNPND